MMRLDKFLALNGYGTRSEVKKMLRQGAVTVNGQPEAEAERKIREEQDAVAVQGTPVLYTPFVCLMFYKPAGCITAASDARRRTVMDYITHPRKKELFAVGRLDLDTEGLLFLMNDGELAHRMLSPGRHVPKTYYVRVDGPLSADDTAAFEAGLEIGEKRPTRPASLTILSSGDVSEASLTICEGKFHQVKRMFAARGHTVLYLKRTAMAGISLDERLSPGMFRELSEEEKERLKGI